MRRDHHPAGKTRRRDHAPSPAPSHPVAARRARARCQRGHSICRTDRSSCAGSSLPGGWPALFPGCSRSQGRPSRPRAHSGECACSRCQRYLRNSVSRSLLCFRPRLRSLSAIFSDPPPRPLEDFLAATQHFVQCFLKIGGAFCKLLPYLRNILLKALFYLLSKELLESAVAETFSVLGRVIGDDIRDQRAREPLCSLIRILRQKGIDRAPRSGIADSRGSTSRSR